MVIRCGLLNLWNNSTCLNLTKLALFLCDVSDVEHFCVEQQVYLYVCLFLWCRLAVNCFFLIWKAALEGTDLLTTTATMD